MPALSLFGVLPTEPQPVRLGGSDMLWHRWSRWLEMSQDTFRSADAGERRCWRFLAPPGWFDEEGVAGVWRLSRSSEGRRLPLALLLSGAHPHPSDPWFDAAAAMLDLALDDYAGLERLNRAAARLPKTGPAAPSAEALFWIDDWEVHELRFPTLHALADEGFPRMLAARPEPVEE
jgi:hypothetical protein